MRTLDQDNRAPGLGKPIRPAPEAAPEPQWKPIAGHKDHETIGTEIRLRQGKLPTIYDWYTVGGLKKT